MKEGRRKRKGDDDGRNKAKYNSDSESALQKGQKRQSRGDGLVDNKTYKQTNKHPAHTIKRILSGEYQLASSLLETIAT